MPLRPRHIPSLTTGAELCPQPDRWSYTHQHFRIRDVNSAMLYHLVTLYTWWFMIPHHVWLVLPRHEIESTWWHWFSPTHWKILETRACISKSLLVEEQFWREKKQQVHSVILWNSSILGWNHSTAYKILEFWAEPVVIFLSWVGPWTIATS